MIGKLPGRYDQLIGKRFRTGLDLSGGEWQKIAIARAYMRDAQVLISHRFSSVRMADRIVVLNEGRVDAVGTHEELLTRGGLYAELFELQAAGYR